jgi:hypothetical protein
MLRTQATYVTEISKGSNAIIATSGFQVSKGGSTKAVVPEMPVYLKLESKNNNVTLITKKPKGAPSFCWVIYYGEVTESVQGKGQPDYSASRCKRYYFKPCQSTRGADKHCYGHQNNSAGAGAKHSRQKRAEPAGKYFCK